MTRMEELVGKEHEMAMNTLYERIIYWGDDEGLITATIPGKYLGFYDDRLSPWSWVGLDHHFFRVTSIDLDNLHITREVVEVLSSLKYLSNITVTESKISEEIQAELVSSGIQITLRETVHSP